MAPIKINKNKNRILIVRAEDPYFNGMLGLILVLFKKVAVYRRVWGNPDETRKNTNELLSHIDSNGYG